MFKKPTRANKRGRIAFITTPMYRKSYPDSIENFIYKNLYSLCHAFDVITTRHTHDFILKTIKRPYVEFLPRHLSLMREDARFGISGNDDLDRWKSVVLSGLQPTMGSFQGMIHVAFELVEGRLDAVIHFTDWQDKSAKPDSAVLSREANVHNVPIATNVETANASPRVLERVDSQNPRGLHI